MKNLPKHKSSTAARLLSLALAAILAETFTGMPALAQDVSALSTPAEQLSHVSSILIFPAANQAGDAFASSGSTLTDDIKIKLNGIGRFHATAYTPTLSAVQRGLNVDETLSVSDLTPPFSDPTKGQKIAQVVGTDGYLLTSLDSESVDQTTHTVVIQATAQIFDTTTNDPIGTFSVKGTATSSGSADETIAVESRAIDSAAAQIVSSLSPTINSSAAVTTVPKQGGGHKFGGSNFLLIVLAGILVAVIVNGTKGSSHSSSSSTTTTTTNPNGPPGSPGI